MSENENQPAPSKQTSSVPLKKETVRVTLKAADAPPAATLPGGAPVVRPPSPTAPSAPTVGGAARPPAPAPTIPLRPAGAPTVPGAPTAPGGAPRPPGPAPTIPLRPAGSPTLPGAGAPAAGQTVALPKATVQLQAPTQPLGSSPRPTFGQTATLAGDDEEESAGGEGIANALSVVGFIAALAVLAFQLMIANTWIGAKDNPEQGSWGQLFSSGAAAE
ncbi:hypothetical protein KBB96_14850 [Luteolibacter ambystomatis]|uniref:Uncharacterized protein n=1 Tax=Luteolibacter ambystomatis TaxID=2824561 RepID=A0A975G6B7_9BACT|nr:hypothetical protein [Luteolibacter ambystomatis]QUE50142.1 hypothetical protein KBB96_14850 [Luteolibacter ambystomatis]